MDYSTNQYSKLETSTPTWRAGFISSPSSATTDACLTKSRCSDFLVSDDSDSCPDFLSDLSAGQSPELGSICNFSLSDFIPDDIVEFVADYSVRHAETDFDLTSNNVADYAASIPQASDSSSSVLSYAEFSLSPDSKPIFPDVKRSTHSKRRREVNREASRRYRQKLKQKCLQTQSDLAEVISAYKRSKLAYEKAEHAFDVLKNIVLDLVSLTP
ncbi:unnamed protein product [Trichobilharzia szidati]|nr:unnamed protein product [Trichobilharzia szidati]